MPEAPSWFEVLKALFQKTPEEHLQEFTEEIGQLVEEAEREGLLSPEEREILLSVLRLRRVAVREIMIPRRELIGFPVDLSAGELWRRVASAPQDYYPIYEGELDNFLGVVSLRDLVRRVGEDFSLRDLVRPVYVIPESLKLREALRGFRERNASVALVIDEFGALSGLLRLRDLLEFLFPVRKRPLRRDAEGWFLLGPDTPLEEAERILGVELPRGDYETLSGLIQETLGRIPSSGEKLVVDGLEVEILAADERAIRSLRVRPLSEKP